MIDTSLINKVKEVETLMNKVVKYGDWRDLVLQVNLIDFSYEAKVVYSYRNNDSGAISENSKESFEDALQKLEKHLLNW